VGNVFVTDTGNATIRKIDPLGVVSTIAGVAGFTNDFDGTGSAARFTAPFGITIDGQGNLYVSDAQSHALRKITPAVVVTTVGGFGTAFNDTPTIAPFGLAADPQGNLLLTDPSTHSVRRLVFVQNAYFTVAGVADQQRGILIGGSPGHLDAPQGIAADQDGNAYVTDENGVLRITFQ
jgi:DNA-binding beta-propeller fold protein YncE